MQNPFRRWSNRTVRIVYSIAAVTAFLICGYHMLDLLLWRAVSNDQCVWVSAGEGKRGLLIKDVIPGGVTDRAGVVNGDTLLQINRIPVTIINAPSVLNAMNGGDTATYLVARGGMQFETKIEIIKLFELFSFSLFILGAGFLLVGWVAVITRPEGTIQRMFSRYGIVCMLIFGLFTLNVGPDDPAWRKMLLALPFFTGRIFAAPVMIGFFLHFPTRLSLRDRRWIMPALYGAGIGMLLLMLFANRLHIGQTATLYLFASPIAFFVSGLGFFVAQYARHVTPDQRRQLRPILIGVIVGVGVLSYIAILTSLSRIVFFLQPTYMLPVLLIIVTPMTFGYSIFRYRLMDVDLILEKSLIYGVVTASLAAIYLGVVFGIGSVVGTVVGNSDSKVLSAAALIVIAFVFDPVKRRVQGSIDRIFYRERHDYQRALLEFSQELPRFIKREQVLDSIVYRISNTMHVEKIAVILCDNREGCTVVAKGIDRECCEFADTQNGLIEHLRRNKAAQILSFLSEETLTSLIRREDQEKIIKSGIVLAVPMLIQDRLIGMITVGPKLSGKVYSQDDIDLLTTVASQAAIAIENSRLHRSEIEKQKIEEELEVARRIQQGLLPRENPRIEHLDVSGITIPALSVGGDYFDFISLGPNKLLVVVADVSGKGISAALYMSKIQGMVQLAARMYHSPKEILVHVNRLLYEGIERRSFITMILGLFDSERRSVRMCRAGHNKAIIGMNGTSSMLEATGIGLGMERGPLFEETLQEVEVPLKPDSRVVFYSDGLSETMNSDLGQLGEETLCRIIEAHPLQSARELQEQLIAAAQQFRGPADQHDDITVVVVRSC